LTTLVNDQVCFIDIFVNPRIKHARCQKYKPDTLFHQTDRGDQHQPHAFFYKKSTHTL